MDLVWSQREGVSVPNEDLYILVWAKSYVSIMERLRDGTGLISQPLLSPQALSSPARHTAFAGCAVFWGMQRNMGEMMTENPEPFLDEFRPQVGSLGSKCSREETRIPASMSSTI